MVPSDQSQGRPTQSHSRRESKVERNIHNYGLDDLGSRLEQLWTDATDERLSLRELATFFNQRLLECVVDQAGLDALAGEVENLYRLLTDDSVSSGRRVQARRRLERAGIDVDKLQHDFVSHQAIHTYLTKHRDASYPDDDRSSLDRETTKLTRLQRRVTAVSEDAISRLDSTGEVEAGNVDVFVEVSVLCRDCGSSYGFEAFLENGGCSCNR